MACSRFRKRAGMRVRAAQNPRFAPASRQSFGVRREWSCRPFCSEARCRAHRATSSMPACRRYLRRRALGHRLGRSRHPDAAMVKLGSNDARAVSIGQTEQKHLSVSKKLTAAHVPCLSRHERHRAILGAIAPLRLSIRGLPHALTPPLSFRADGVASIEAQPEDGIHPKSCGVKGDRRAPLSLCAAADAETRRRRAPLMFIAPSSVGGFTLLSRITGFARDILMAWILGKGVAVGRLHRRVPVPNYFRAIFGEGRSIRFPAALCGAACERASWPAAELFRRPHLLVQMAAQLVILVLALIFMPAIIKFWHQALRNNPAQLALTVQLARITSLSHSHARCRAAPRC